jgi:hypothetical protein
LAARSRRPLWPTYESAMPLIVVGQRWCRTSKGNGGMTAVGRHLACDVDRVGGVSAG